MKEKFKVNISELNGKNLKGYIVRVYNPSKTEILFEYVHPMKRVALEKLIKKIDELKGNGQENQSTET